MNTLSRDTANCFCLWYMPDGSTISSTRKYWKEIAWDQVVKIEAFINGARFIFSQEGKVNFKGFVNFRYGGNEAVYVRGEFSHRREINVWAIGWTDGINCYMTEIDVNLGIIVKDEVVMPIKECMAHLHPRLKNKL